MDLVTGSSYGLLSECELMLDSIEWLVFEELYINSGIKINVYRSYKSFS